MAFTPQDFATAAAAAQARGDFALRDAINALPHAAIADPDRYAAIVKPVTDAIAAAESAADRKPKP